MDLNNKVLSDFNSMKDLKYKEFNDKIINDKKLNTIGVPIPKLRSYAKMLNSEYSLDYLLNNIKNDTVEQLLLKSMLIGFNKNLNFATLKSYINDFVPKISNWCICDNFCSNLKITKKYLIEMFEVINFYLKSDKEFEIRFALVMLLNYYITDEYIDKIFEIVNNINCNNTTTDLYYVKMAKAWLISFCFIKNYEKTYFFLKNNAKLDDFTYKKSIQKAKESYRLTKEQKQNLQNLLKK